jgi:hypothetical protein
MFSQEIMDIDEYLKQFCVPSEEAVTPKPTEIQAPKPEEVSIWQKQLAGFPLLGWILLGGALLGFLFYKKKEEEEIK